MLKFFKDYFFRRENSNNEKAKEKKAHKCVFPDIDPFAYCISNPYFRCSENFSKIFSEFETRIASLQRYFEINNLHIKQYINMSKTELKNRKNSDYDDLDIKAFGVCHFADVEYFYEMHYLSILLMLFTLFETLLFDMTKDISKDQGKYINFSEKEVPYINKYAMFLKEKCGLNIDINKASWNKLNIIRKVRNNYLHSLDKDIPENLQLELAETLGEQKHKITVDEEFISMTFEIIGDIAQEFEKAYWDYKKEKFKIN